MYLHQFIYVLLVTQYWTTVVLYVSSKLMLSDLMLSDLRNVGPMMALPYKQPFEPMKRVQLDSGLTLCCQRWPNKVNNIAPTLAQQYHVIWDAPLTKILRQTRCPWGQSFTRRLEWRDHADRLPRAVPSHRDIELLPRVKAINLKDARIPVNLLNVQDLRIWKVNISKRIALFDI